MSLVRTTLLCCALFLAAHAWAPAIEEPTRREASTPVAASVEPSCRAHGCGCPHERALEACCCAGDTIASMDAAEATPRALPRLDPSSEVVVARADDGSPRAAFVPFRCAGNSRSSSDAPASPGTLAEPSREPAVAPAPSTWQVWPNSRPPGEPSSEPLTPPPRDAGHASMV